MEEHPQTVTHGIEEVYMGKRGEIQRECRSDEEL
jgi:hypothetical protein